MAALDQRAYSKPWHIKYRPRSFKEISGQKEIGLLRHILIAEGTCPPPAILLSGPSGVGKTTAARVAAAALNCSGQDAPCGSCSGCLSVLDGLHQSCIEVDAATSGSAEDMRKLRDISMVHTGGHQCFIIDEAHSISWQGWNVLLKTLEEPVGNTTFILVTSEPFKVPSKIRTRCIRFDFSSVPPKAIEDRLLFILNSEGFNLDQDYIDLIIDESRGSMREAIKMLEVSAKSEEPLGRKDMALDLLESIIYNDTESGVKCLQTWWSVCGSVRDIVYMIGQALEDVVLVKYNIEKNISEAKKHRLEKISDTITDNQWASLMESISDWSTRDGGRAHLSMLWSVLRKSVHGSASEMVNYDNLQSRPKKNSLSKEEIINQLKGV